MPTACLQLNLPPLPHFVTIGHGKWLPGMQHFERTFGVYDLIFIRSGCLYMTEDGIPYAIGPNHLLVLEPGKTHYGHAPCTEDTIVYWTHFAHSGQAATIDSDAIPWQYGFAPSSDNDQQPVPQAIYLPKFGCFDLVELYPLLDELNRLNSHLQVHNTLELHALYARLLAKLQALLQPKTPTRSQTLAAALATYLQQHLQEPYRAHELEQALHFNIDYLSRCLRQHTGMSPLQYLHHLRLERAKQLLEQTDLPIHAVAEETGMPNPNYFIRLFRERVGVTPSSYRRARQRYT